MFDFLKLVGYKYMKKAYFHNHGAAWVTTCHFQIYQLFIMNLNKFYLSAINNCRNTAIKEICWDNNQCVKITKVGPKCWL